MSLAILVTIPPTGGIVIQAVILAAGRGTRLNPLTQQMPKCLISLGGRPLLQRLIMSLHEAGISFLTIGVGWRGEQIRNALEDVNLNIDVNIVTVPDYEIGALQTLATSARDVTEPVLVSPADYLATPEVLRTMLSTSPLNEDQCVLRLAVSRGDYGAVVYGTPDGTITGLNSPILDGSIVGRSAMSLIATPRFLELCRSLLAQGMTSVSDAINHVIQGGQACYTTVPSHWVDVDSPTELLSAARFLVEFMPNMIDGLVVPHGDVFEIGTRLVLDTGSELDPGVKIHGPAYVGHGSMIGSGCMIGPNAFIEPETVLGERVELRDSLVFRGVTLPTDTKMYHAIALGNDTIHVGD